MAGSSLNRTIISGNLTRDPSLKTLESGTKLVELRVAVNTRVKRGGEWTDKPNFFNVTVFGNQADAIKKYLAKGSPVAIDGRLDWREYEAKDGGKREAIQIIADSVQFLPDSQQRSGNGNTGASDIPYEEMASTAAPAEDDDIPF